MVSEIVVDSGVVVITVVLDTSVVEDGTSVDWVEIVVELNTVVVLSVVDFSA